MLTNSSLPMILIGGQMHWAECFGWVELTGRGGGGGGAWHSTRWGRAMCMRMVHVDEDHVQAKRQLSRDTPDEGTAHLRRPVAEHQVSVRMVCMLRTSLRPS